MKHHLAFSRFLHLTILLLLASLPLGNALEAGPSSQAADGAIVRVSVASDGTPGNQDSGTGGIAVSADGRYIAFASGANNLVTGDTNHFGDVFVHDRTTGVTSRVSLVTGGAQANGASWMPAISADGRYVAFESDATNLAGDDIYNYTDIFVHDRQTGVTSCVSLPAWGKDLAWLAGPSHNPAISADGRYVAFDSYAQNLIGQDADADGDCDIECDTNGYSDVFLHDRQTGQTVRVSVSSNGDEADNHSNRPAISQDGAVVAFDSAASNLVAADTNSHTDVFIHTPSNGLTRRVSVNSSGEQGDGTSYAPTVAANGLFVAYESDATNLVAGDSNNFSDIFVYDRLAQQTRRVSVSTTGAQGNQHAHTASISADGRYIAFQSFATNLVDGDTNGFPDIFIHDRQIGQTSRASLAFDGAQALAPVEMPAIAADGRSVGFVSIANHLVSGDTTGLRDVFVHKLGLLVNATTDRPDASLADNACDTGQVVLRNGTPEPECTLRAAIQQANASQLNAITFDIPGVAGVPVISPATVLPDITTPLTLDASSQPGAGRVTLDGASSGAGISGLIVDADDVFVYGLTVQHFGWNGIYFDTPEDRLLTLGAVTLSDNCQWGLASAGSVNFTNWHDQPNRIERNGSGEGCQAGGVLLWGDPERVTLEGFGLQVNDNDGPGLLATGNIELTGRSDAPLGVTGNNGDGIFARNGRVTLVTVDGEHEVSGNQGRGIAAHGTCGEDTNGGILLEGIVYGVKLNVNDNAGWGLAGCAVEYPSGSLVPITLLTAHNNGRGPTCQYWDWGIDGNLTGKTMDCWGGGVLAYAEGVSVHATAITTNGGPGVLAYRGAELWGNQTDPVNISNNQGDGVFALLGAVQLKLYEGSHQVSGNQGRGIVAMGAATEDDIGGIRIEGKGSGGLDVRDNAGWGLVSAEVGLPQGDAGVFIPINIVHNGYGPTCWSAGLVRFDRAFPFVHWRIQEDCRGGGVLVRRGDAYLTGAQIRDNNGPGILARGAVGLVNSAARPLQITGNQGTGVQSESGQVELELYGSGNQIAANQGDGIATMGLGVGITGNLDIRRNAGRGIYSYGAVSVGWLAGAPIEIWKVTVFQNGADGKCFKWQIRSSWGTYAETPCPAGGIVADHGEVRLARVEVDNNWGNGIFASGDVILHNGLVIDNGGYGIQLRGVLTQTASEISSNSLGGINVLPPPEAPVAYAFTQHASRSTIQSSQIRANTGDGVRFEGGSGLEMTYTNLWSNTGLGANNLLSATLSLTATHNWWGDAAGPFGPNGDGVSARVDTSPWLSQPVGLTAYPAANPIYAPPGQLVTATVFIQNWATLSDTVTITWSDSQGWITPTAPGALSLDALGAPVFIPLTVPPGAALGAVDVVAATVVSSADPAASAVASFQVIVAPVADLRLRIASPADISVPYTYTLQVANAGPSAAADTNVTIALPNGASLLSAISTQGSCAGSATLLCLLGTLESGSAVTLTVRVQLAVGLGPLTAQAEVTASTFDPDPYNNADLTWVEVQSIDALRLYVPLVVK